MEEIGMHDPDNAGELRGLKQAVKTAQVRNARYTRRPQDFGVLFGDARPEPRRAIRVPCAAVSPCRFRHARRHAVTLRDGLVPWYRISRKLTPSRQKLLK